MAKHTKEQLQKLLDFLRAEVLTVPGNEWFAESLLKILPVHQSWTRDSVTIQQLAQYLGLDYYLDKATPIIDYSFVKNEYLRNCLDADCREMLRYRYGTRGHCVDFAAFCRYAHMQAERLLNIYYMNVSNDISEIVAYIRRFNEKGKISDNPSSVESIFFITKLWAFKYEHRVDRIYNTLYNVTHLRNDQSHGSASIIEPDFMEKHLEMLRSYGFPMRSDNLVDWKRLEMNDPELYQFYKDKIYKSKEHDLYVHYIWRERQPFDEVISAIRELVKIISKYV